LPHVSLFALIFFVLIVNRTGTGADDCANCRSRASADCRACRCAARGAYAYAFDRFTNCAAMPSFGYAMTLGAIRRPGMDGRIYREDRNRPCHHSAQRHRGCEIIEKASHNMLL
jgi:hypothetical protein